MHLYYRRTQGGKVNVLGLYSSNVRVFFVRSHNFLCSSCFVGREWKWEAAKKISEHEAGLEGALERLNAMLSNVSSAAQSTGNAMETEWFQGLELLRSEYRCSHWEPIFGKPCQVASNKRSNKRFLQQAFVKIKVQLQGIGFFTMNKFLRAID